MTKKENTKLIKLLFEVYRKGVEGEECNLDDSLKELLVAINYTCCWGQVRKKSHINFVKIKIENI